MYFLRTSKHINPSKFGEFDGALRTALSSICNVQEPSGISAHDGRHPDGCTLIPWRAGRCLAWDVTVPGTLAERYVNLTSKECGLDAARAADEKMKKYGNAFPSMEFLPICIEVLGPIDPNTLKFLKEICKMISVRSGDSRELFFATNHISCLLQRFLREAGAVALRAADFKNSKYAALAESKIFQPVCIETFGPTDAQTQSFLNELCSRIVEVSGDPLDKSYVKQSFSILLQKYNSFCILDGALKYLSVRSV
ncbi:hypothetical protein HELRODRAFT_182945 [Helobdella robusta]|uniref:Uncharacterized protein n=1 Tax=Helobdella robusta TaxID=6412 RepID=T1FIY5_HELRO|nr:hypothetical protein HELRODRAFT_182945 [Helobdella robusta]ESN90041.1 hypothetical protein HELRODRAFT_182945 [Helobdella robusta]